MKTTALAYISLVTQLITAAPPIPHPPLTLLPSPLLPNLTHPLSHTPPHPPFHLPVPSAPLTLTITSTRHEITAHTALLLALSDAHQHPRAQSIARSIPEPFIFWPGDPDPAAPDATDIELTPGRELTWGMWADCLGVVAGFMARYPGWDFGFEIEWAERGGEAGGV